MLNFLGIGECMVELSQAANGQLAQGYAGDVLNTLWYARACLQDDTYIGFHSAFGQDPLSQEMRGFIEAAGISCDNTPTDQQRLPGLYMIHLDGAERSFSYWRENSAARSMMKDPALLWQRAAQADLIYLSGITMAILPEDAAQLLIKTLRDHLKPTAKVAFDPNIRPRLWSDETRMQEVLTATAAISDIILPSADDERMCFGDASPEDTAQRYRQLGAELVVVKNGEAATLVLQGDQMSSYPVPDTPGVVDTTAAGDSFNGAFLASYLTSGDLEQATKAAQRCAAQVVCKKGALVPFEQLSL